MTVRELIDLLQDFGGHLEVEIAKPDGGRWNVEGVDLLPALDGNLPHVAAIQVIE